MENKIIRFWLIQTGQIEKDLSSDEITLGCGNTKFVSFNYMGSAEYEFGASRNSFRYIMDNYEDYDLFETYLQNPNGVPFQIFCRKEDFRLLQESIAAYSRSCSDRGLKEPCRLWTHFLSGNETHSFYSTEDLKVMRYRNNFWWDFENHWMGFFGVSDRVNAFKRAIENDRVVYLKNKAQSTYR